MIEQLKKMCSDNNFDMQRAKEALSTIDVNQVFEAPILGSYTYQTTLLDQAIRNANIRMVDFLLQNGANPDLVFDNTAVLWDLQYNDGETAEENEIRLAITRKLLENGADPHIIVEGEDLYHWALACSQDDDGELYEYRTKFIEILEEFIEK